MELGNSIQNQFGQSVATKPNYEPNYPYDLRSVVKDVSELLDFDKFEFNDDTLMLQGKYAGQTAKEVMEKDFRYLIWADMETMQRLSPKYIRILLEQEGSRMDKKTRDMYLEKERWQIYCRGLYDDVKSEIFFADDKKFGQKKLSVYKNQRNLHDKTIEILKERNLIERARRLDMSVEIMKIADQIKNACMQKSGKKAFAVEASEDLINKQIVIKITEGAWNAKKKKVTTVTVNSKWT